MTTAAHLCHNFENKMSRKMKQSITILSIIALAFFGTGNVGAQTSDQLFQQGLMKEQGEGDLKAAIDIYSSLLEKDNANRELKANALLHIGLCNEKLGKSEAIKSYKKLVSQYPDQRDVLVIALNRLKLLENNLVTENTSNPKSTFTQIPLNLDINFESHTMRSRRFDISPDGNEFVIEALSDIDVYSGWRKTELYLSDISGSVVRKLLNDSANFINSTRPVYSPDGNSIAFSGSRYEGDPADGNIIKGLYVVDRDGGNLRLIEDVTEGKYLDDVTSGKYGTSLIWNHLSDQVIFFKGGAIVSVNLKGEVVNSIPFDFDWTMGLSEYSPDGNWIAYNKLNIDNDSLSGIEIWLISTKGDKNFQLVNYPGDDGFATWNKDGDALYYVSEKNGEKNVWKVNISAATGKVMGDPQQVTFYNSVNILYPRKLSGSSKLGFITLFNNRQVQLVDVLQPEKYKVLASGFGAVFSAEEKDVYYIDNRVDHKGIYIISVDGGNPKKLTSIHPQHKFKLSPDGRYISFFTTSKDGLQSSLHLLNTQTRDLKVLTSFQSSGDLLPEWSPDSKKLAYARDKFLHVYNIVNGEDRPLAEVEMEGWTLRWSPDGAHIAGLAYLENEVENHGMLVSSSTGEVTRITPVNETEYKEGLEWHPDGKRLAYMYYQRNDIRDGLREAYVDGSPTKHFIDQPNYWDYLGTWTPDGKFFYFEASNGAWNLFRYDDVTKEISYFSGKERGTSGDLDFTNDAKTIVRSSQLSEYKLWIMDHVD